MQWQNIFTLIKHHIRQVIGLYILLLVPMWVMFVLNNTILLDYWNSFGIVPRTLSVKSILGIFASWTMHGNFAHIFGNTMVMVQILFLFGLFERNAYRTIAMLIIGSGFMTWGLGSTFSIHVGASGLIFAMLGYMIGGAVFAKRWGYLIACVLMGTSYWFIIKEGLIPQVGISFAGHFGGLCAGLLLGSNSKHDYPQIGSSR